MSKYVVAILVSVAIAFMVSFGLSALFTAAGLGRSHAPLLAGILIGVFAAYIMANLAGNRKVATADADARARALDFTPPPGKAVIYLYREGFVGRAAGLNLAIDGKVVAQLKSPRFTRVVVSPGGHSLSAAFGGLAGAQNASSETPLSLAAGDVAAFRYAVAMGLARNTIAVTAVTDLEAAKRALARMPMTVPDVAEI